MTRLPCLPRYVNNNLIKTFRIRFVFFLFCRKIHRLKIGRKNDWEIWRLRERDGERRSKREWGMLMMMMKIVARIQKWNSCLNIDWHQQVLRDGYRLILIGTRTTKDGNIDNAISIKNKREWIININIRYSILPSIINWMRVLFVRFVLVFFSLSLSRPNSIGLLTDSFISINLWRCMRLSACIHIHVCIMFFFVELNGTIIPLIVEDSFNCRPLELPSISFGYVLFGECQFQGMLR